jgi:vitamin B12 transporter
MSGLLSARFDNTSAFENAFTGRLALTYELTDDSRLYGSIGSGQKAPTFIERFGYFPGQFVGNSQLKPEKSTSFDVGIEQAWRNGDLTAQLTYFRQDLKNEINGFVFDPLTFLSTAENLPGKSARQGIEFAGRLEATSNLGFGATYTYTDSTAEDDQGRDIRELRRPRHIGSAQVNYRFRDNRANLLLVADYGGEQFDAYFPPFPSSSEIVTLDAFWLLGLTASYDVSEKLNVFVRVSNLLDEEYEEVFGYRTPGRGAYLGLRATFGR